MRSGLAALVGDAHLPNPWRPAAPPPDLELLARVLAGLERLSPTRRSAPGTSGQATASKG
ncbi:MAG: hypothetical protein ACRDRL_27600 [Sciscionella sp.]